MSSEVKVIAKIESKGITITSDGLAKDAEGTIIATGVLLEGNQIVASDGTILWKAEETTVIGDQNQSN